MQRDLQSPARPIRTTRMKVCIVSGDAVGGVRKHVHEILLSAMRKDIDFLYIHSATSDTKAELDFKLIEQARIPRIGLAVKKRPSLGDLPNLVRIVGECRRAGIQAIHGHGAKGGLYARLAGSILGVPVIYTPHGGSVHRRFGRVQSWLYRSTERILAPLTRLFVFESNYTHAAFTAQMACLPPSRYLINYNGVDAGKYRTTSSWQAGLPMEVRLLVVGSLQRLKGQHVALQALARLRASGVPATLDFCGGGEERAELERFADGLGMRPHVAFSGDVPDVAVHFERCNIVLIPSLFESFGYVAVEAALARRPVVAAATGGLCEVVVDGSTGRLTPAGNAEALADAVRQMLADIPRTSKMVERAAERASREFSSARMLETLHRTYAQFIGR